jgi:hypothetical protein
MNKPNNWLTIRDVQNHVKSFDRHWSRTHIQNLIRAKKLKSFKISASRFFLKKDVEKYLKTLKRKAPKIIYEKS